MKILFLTTANLSTNPRLLKELSLVKSQNFSCKIIAFRLGNWFDDNDGKIIQQNGFNVEYISATRSPFFPWLVSSILQRACELLDFFNKSNLLIKVLASGKRTFLLTLKIKKIKDHFDLVIAHNQGAFYPAFLFSRNRKIPFILDIEDFHPGEKCSLAERHRREFIFEKIVTKSNFIYNASPLIEKATLNLLSASVRSTVINNVFSKDDFSFKNAHNDKISLVWFSQNISAGRGLELVIPSIFERRDAFHLILIGKLNQQFFEGFLHHYSSCLLIKQPMSQAELNSKICNYDIGLALELDTADDNRKLCLTNKIWAYYQAGLFILATDTPAQISFLDANQDHGVLMKQSKEFVDFALSDILENKKVIHAKKQERFLRAGKCSWEEEQTKLLQIWRSAVQKEAP